MKLNGTTYILVANASEASVYFYKKTYDELFDKTLESLESIKVFSHVDSRKKDSNLRSDKLGNYSSVQGGQGTFVERSTVKAQEVEVFAQEIVGWLESKRTSNSLSNLIMIASPAFLGMMNGVMNKHLEQLVLAKIPKDLTHEKESTIIEALHQELGLQE